jgi:hypothetical protein
MERVGTGASLPMILSGFPAVGQRPPERARQPLGGAIIALPVSERRSTRRHARPSPAGLLTPLRGRRIPDCAVALLRPLDATGPSPGRSAARLDARRARGDDLPDAQGRRRLTDVDFKPCIGSPSFASPRAFGVRSTSAASQRPPVGPPSRFRQHVGSPRGVGVVRGYGADGNPLAP